MSRSLHQSDVCLKTGPTYLSHVHHHHHHHHILQYYQQASQNASGWLLPIRWMAPESFYDGIWDVRSDAWMFGVLLWGMRMLFSIVCVDCNDVTHSVRRQQKLARPASCPDRVYDVMWGCWKIDPSTRVTATEALASISGYYDECAFEDDLRHFDWPSFDDAVVVSSLTEENYNIDLNSPDLMAAFEALELNPQDVLVEHELGRGEFGCVQRARVHGHSVAVKTLKSSELEFQHKFLSEARLLSALRHPNIVDIIGVCSKQQPLMIVLDLMASDLRKYLNDIGKRGGKVNESELLHVCAQIASAMEFLAANNIVHRDLATRSVREYK